MSAKADERETFVEDDSIELFDAEGDFVTVEPGEFKDAVLFVGASPAGVWLDRAQAVALRDWINGQLGEGEQ